NTWSMISTDPPYYDNIGYADLADFFYVWLRTSLRDIIPGLFGTLLSPKLPELVAIPYRFQGRRQEAQQFFEGGIGRAFSNIRALQNRDYPLSVYYAFKQAESASEDELTPAHREDGKASTGWETMLAGLLAAGFQVTGTWPVRSESSVRMNALAA